MMKIHELKLDVNFADDVNEGRKNFEVRLCDRGYQATDLVRFQVVNHRRECLKHELTKKLYEITYVLSGFGIKDGWVVFGIKETND